MKDSQDNDSIENAEEVIKRFGGIRPMATKMSVPVTTVQGWKKRNVIPGNRLHEVLEAADRNNIDLGDTLQSAANENTDNIGQSSRTFEHVIKTEMAKPEIDNAKKHEDSIRAAQQTMAKEEKAASLAGEQSVNISTEAMLGKIKQSERKAVQKSVLVSVILLVLTVGFVSFLFWPAAHDGSQTDERLGALESDVANVQEKQSFLASLVPEDLRAQLTAVKEQAQSAQQTVAVIKSEAQALSQDLLDPNLAIGERLTRLEERVEGLGAPAQLTDLIQKVQTLQGSLEGQEQLARSIADLSGLMQGMQGRVDNIDQTLAQAQTENDALGQTLEGLSKEDLKAGAMLLTLTQFRNALDRQEPFAQDLQVMQNMLGTEDPALQEAINRLAPHATDGVLSPQKLSSEFKGLAGDIVVSSLKGEDVSVREKALARFNEVLSVEKDGELITGTDTQATVARAQKLLDEGNIQGAMAELQSLEGGAADAAKPWIDQAQATLLAEQLEGLFTGKVVNQVSASRLTSGGAGSAGSLSVENLINQIQGMTPGKVVTDEASGFRILQPSKIELPQ